MRSLIRPPLLAVTALLLVLGGASLYLASAKADDADDRGQRHPDKKHKPTKRQVRDSLQRRRRRRPAA